MARILIGYDIHANSRRRKALKTLRALTACYQYSFFDCELGPPQVARLFSELTERLDPSEDGLIFAWLNPAHTGALGQRWASGGQSLYLVN